MNEHEYWMYWAKMAVLVEMFSYGMAVWMHLRGESLVIVGLFALYGNLAHDCWMSVTKSSEN